MFGKIFESMFDGSLHGNFEGLVLMQALVILSDKDGNVDMTPRAIAARTSYPIEVVEAGLKILTAPDPDSRIPDEGGRRLVLIDPDRSWGWRIVNHAHYRAKGTGYEVREKARLRKRAERERKKSNQNKENNTDTDTYTYTGMSPMSHVTSVTQRDNSKEKQELWEPDEQVLMACKKSGIQPTPEMIATFQMKVLDYNDKGWSPHLRNKFIAHCKQAKLEQTSQRKSATQVATDTSWAEGLVINDKKLN